MIYASCQGHHAGDGGTLYPAGYWITVSVPAASTRETSALPLFRDLCVYTISPSVLYCPLHYQIRPIPLCSLRASCHLPEAIRTLLASLALHTTLPAQRLTPSFYMQFLCHYLCCLFQS